MGVPTHDSTIEEIKTWLFDHAIEGSFASFAYIGSLLMQVGEGKEPLAVRCYTKEMIRELIEQRYKEGLPTAPQNDGWCDEQPSWYHEPTHFKIVDHLDECETYEQFYFLLCCMPATIIWADVPHTIEKIMRFPFE